MKKILNMQEAETIVNKILNSKPIVINNGTRDSSKCPFCSAYVIYEQNVLENMDHDKDCLYLISKNL